MTKDREKIVNEIVASLQSDVVDCGDLECKKCNLAASAVLDIALKVAADIAKDHKGSAKRKRIERGLRLSKFSTYEQDEILAEERGGDIASGIIASAILSLISKEAKS